MLTVPSLFIRQATRPLPVNGVSQGTTLIHVCFFYDARFPFGTKSSLGIFHRITQAVRCMTANRGYHNIVAYLDDFLVIGATKEFGLPNPLLNNWPLKSLLTGINTCKGLISNHKQPIIPAVLLQLHAKLDLTSSHDASFCGVCLAAFYGMVCKSHLLPVAAHQFNTSKQLTKADFKMFHRGALLTVPWSKTIQLRERAVEIPLPYIPGSILCRTTA